MGVRNIELKREIFFPVNNKTREFISRALLGAIFADHGYRVYIGVEKLVNATVLSKPEKGGVYFYKGIRLKPDTPDLLAKVDAFCVLDEEAGLAVQQLEQYLKRRVKGMSRVDRYFTISRRVANTVVSICPESAGKVFATGWPKVDTWRPEMARLFRSEAQNYRQRLGKFVLFTSDFGVLSQNCIDDFISHKKNDKFSVAYEPHTKPYLEKTLFEFENFIEDLRRYDALPNAPLIIVRPHPAEDHMIWEERLAELSSVKVIFEGDVSSWLHACHMLIHRGCTTAVQARVGGIPAFCWTPNNVANAKDTLPNKLSTPIRSLSEIIGHWPDPLAAMDNEPIPQELLELGEKLSIEQIFDEVESLGVKPTRLGQKSSKKRLTLQLKIAWWKIVRSRTCLARIFISAKRARKLQNGFHAAELSSFLAEAFPAKTYKVHQASIDLLLLEAGRES